MAETVGTLADKLSILELRIYHMREQLERQDVDGRFRDLIGARLAVLAEQRADLSAELAAIADGILKGRIRPKVYQQFKMYNDPAYRPAADTRKGSG
ncbi:MAG: DUF4254 domain-containing protein [Gemmatimonadota bacterium]